MKVLSITDLPQILPKVSINNIKTSGRFHQHFYLEIISYLVNLKHLIVSTGTSTPSEDSGHSSQSPFSDEQPVSCEISSMELNQFLK